MQILVPGLHKLAALCIIFLRQLFPNMIDKFQRDGERPVIRNFLFILVFFHSELLPIFRNFRIKRVPNLVKTEKLQIKS